MAGMKRSWEGKLVVDNDGENNNAKPQTPADMSDESSQILSMFGTFRNELDEHHDRRERVIKASRDITALSKKIIFALQRVRTTNAPLPASITKEITPRFEQILTLFRSVIPDVTGLKSWRYQRQLSGAIQEFIEALSFHHYLQTQTLISLNEVAARLPSEILVTEEDYVLGLFDLTGEMMRFAVTSLSTGGQQTREGVESEGKGEGQLPKLPPSHAGIVVDLREMRSSFELLNIPARHNMFRDMAKKVDVMQTSVEKVERAAYGILVRGSERPAGWTPDFSSHADMEVY